MTSIFSVESELQTVCRAERDEFDGFFSELEDIRWLVLIKGYFDETFDEHSGSVWVAGHVGDKQAWTKYVADWKLALGARNQLHMSALRWKKPFTQTLLSRLGPIPFESGLLPLAGGVCTGDIIDLITGTRFEHHLNGYVLSLIDATSKAIATVPDGERLEIMFEDRDQTREHALDALFAMKIMGRLAKADSHLCNSDGSIKLAKWGFVMGSGTVLFDQADYLCYALLQQQRDAKSQKAVWCKPILEHGEGDCKPMSRDSARSAFIDALNGLSKRE